MQFSFPSTRDRIVVELNSLLALGAVSSIKSFVGWFKPGPDLLTKMSLDEFVRELSLTDIDLHVFHDSDLISPPDRLLKISKGLSARYIDVFTVNALAGPGGIRAAVKGALGRKVMVNMRPSDHLYSIDSPVSWKPEDKIQLVEIARWVRKAGAAGIICLPDEIRILRSYSEFDGLALMATGVEVDWVPRWQSDKTKKGITISQAVQMGADMVFVGKYLVGYPDIVNRAIELERRIEAALAERTAKAA